MKRGRPETPYNERTFNSVWEQLRYIEDKIINAETKEELVQWAGIERELKNQLQLTY